MDDIPRFDKVWHLVITNHDKLVAHANGIQRRVRLFRRAAYRFASNLLLIQKYYHNEFLDQAKSCDLDIDKWMDEYFEPIEAMGETRQRLLAAIEAGMSEAEYVEQGAVWLVRKHLRSPDKTVRAPDATPKVDVDRLSSEEKLDYLTAHCDSLTSQIQGLKAENRQLRRDLAIATQENERMRKRIAKAERLLNAEQSVAA